MVLRATPAWKAEEHAEAGEEGDGAAGLGDGEQIVERDVVAADQGTAGLRAGPIGNVGDLCSHAAEIEDGALRCAGKAGAEHAGIRASQDVKDVAGEWAKSAIKRERQRRGIVE